MVVTKTHIALHGNVRTGVVHVDISVLMAIDGSRQLLECLFILTLKSQTSDPSCGQQPHPGLRL